MAQYATVEDIIAMGVSLTTQQIEAATQLCEAASSKLRVLAKKNGVDIDALTADEDYANVVKQTVCQAVIRALSSISNSLMPAVTQESQSGLGYSASMTYLNAGQSLYFLRNELKDLGINRQRYGALEVNGNGSVT